MHAAIWHPTLCRGDVQRSERRYIVSGKFGQTHPLNGGLTHRIEARLVANYFMLGAIKLQQIVDKYA